MQGFWKQGACHRIFHSYHKMANEDKLQISELSTAIKRELCNRWKQTWKTNEWKIKQ